MKKHKKPSAVRVSPAMRLAFELTEAGMPVPDLVWDKAFGDLAKQQQKWRLYEEKLEKWKRLS